MIVAALDIAKARDEGGNEIEPLCDYTPGIVRYVRSSDLLFSFFLSYFALRFSHPRPFKCSILPRSEKAIFLVQFALEENPLEKGDGEVLKSL